MPYYTFKYFSLHNRYEADNSFCYSCMLQMRKTINCLNLLESRSRTNYDGILQDIFQQAKLKVASFLN